MKIRHREYGEVDGVELVQHDDQWVNWMAWEKNGVVYFPGKGWSEVKEPQYVDVTGECGLDDDGDLKVGNGLAVLPVGHRFCKRQWFDLPENLLHHIYSMTVKGFIDYIQQFKKPCLIVEKEEG